MTLGGVLGTLSWRAEPPLIVPSLSARSPTRYLERHGYRVVCWGGSSRLPPTRVMMMRREADALRVAKSIGRGVVKGRRGRTRGLPIGIWVGEQAL